MDHPLIVHLADTGQINEWVSAFPPCAQALAEAFWPGPLTLILPKAEGVLDEVTGGQQTVGIRVPRHPVAQALLKSFGSGIAAPSANRFGRLSPTTAVAVQEELRDSVDFILNGGRCEIGLESTIVDVSSESPVILRPGVITGAQIEAVIHQPLFEKKQDVPRVPGSLEAHYAPTTPTQLLPALEIEYFLTTLKKSDFPLALVIRSRVAPTGDDIAYVEMPADPGLYAHTLYQILRELDHERLKRIVIEDVPRDEAWSAIRDRLIKASQAHRELLS
jgi:L-threonylcarbamoyladenylate synthase